MPSPTKKNILIVSSALVLAVGGATFALSRPTTTGADTSPLVQQVQHDSDRIDNHEARITNTENDVKDLQNKTDTSPSVIRVPVPVVTSTSPTQALSAPAPAQVTVSAVAQVKNGNDTDCKLTYTDGTSITKQWRIFDGSDGLTETVHYLGVCDNTLVGQIK